MAVEGYPVQAGSVDPYTGYDTMLADAGFELVRAGGGAVERSGVELCRQGIKRRRSRPGTVTASRARRG